MDGVMQAPGGPTEDPTKGFKFGGWAMARNFSQEFGDELDRLFKEKFDLLLGRKNLRDFRRVLALPGRRRSPWRQSPSCSTDIKKYAVFAPSGEIDTGWAGSVRPARPSPT